MRVAVLVLAFALAGCGDTATETPPTESQVTPTATPSEAPTATAEPQPDTPFTLRQNTKWAKEELPGLTEEEARERARERGLTVRVIRRNQRNLLHTEDLIRTRVNVAVDDGTVTRVVDLG